VIALPELERIADEKFTPDKFDRVRDVCVFAEHDTVDSKGREQHYDRSALEAIVERCNRRIQETGDFAVLTDGHTPDSEEASKGAGQPKVIGFAGPYKLGTIGKDKPKYAIFADEFRFKDEQERFERLPRRSVELWMDDDMAQRFFDPIACLGAETPRLDLGIRFAKSKDGKVIERYAAVAPSGSNTFVEEFAAQPSEDIPADKAKEILEHGEAKGHPLTKKQQGLFGAAAEKHQAEETNSMLTPEDKAELIDAISQLDVFQWARGQMEAQANAATMDQPGVGNGMENGGAAYQAEEDEAPSEAAMENGGEKEEYESDEDDNKDEYAKGGEKKKQEPQADPEKERVIMSRTQYQDLKEDYRKLKAENEKYRAGQEQIDRLVRESSDAKREKQLSDLAHERAVDLDKELDRCLYSRGSKMSDQQFADHIETINEYAPEIPVGRSLPQGELPRDKDTEKYERDLSDRVRKYADMQRRAGKHVTYDQAVSAVEAEMKTAT
jgi:hypothetical protein